jgi:chromosome segregation ATPase
MEDPQQVWTGLVAAFSAVAGGALGLITQRYRTEQTRAEAVPKIEAEESAQMSALVEALKASSAQINAQANQINAMQAQILELISSRQKQSGKITAQESLIKDLQHQLEDLTGRLAEAERERDLERERVDELSAHVDALQVQLRTLNAEPVPAPKPNPKKLPNRARKG